LPKPIISNVYKDDKSNNIFIIGNVKNYNVKLQIQYDKQLLTSVTKCYCSCPSFKYEFMYALYKFNGLCDKEADFFKKSLIIPKKKNIHIIPNGCKHIVVFCQTIQKMERQLKLKSL
jgi:hypothetical protein